jgi:hypothetical protein
MLLSSAFGVDIAFFSLPESGSIQHVVLSDVKIFLLKGQMLSIAG